MATGFKILIKNAMFDTHRDLAQVWTRGWMAFLAVAALIELNHYLMLLWGSTLGVDWGPPLADFMAGLVASTTYILVIPIFVHDVRHKKPNTNFAAHMKKHFNQLMIEMLRVAGKVTIGLFLLIIPGIIWSVRLTFVPLIAQFDEAYLSGSVDAMKRSEQMVKGRFGAIFGLSVLFFIISMLESLKYYFQPSSIFYWLFFAFNLFIEVYMYTLFFSVFEKLVPNDEGGS